ncbi:MAG: ribulose-phosphate 3-epimerase [Lachnospirales bacterium]
MNNKENILSVSILASDFSKLGEEIELAVSNGAKYVHIDVMDGIFVPSISFGVPVIKSIRSKTTAVFDVHLMIEKPERYIKDFVDAGADIITVHYESTNHLDRTLELIKSFGVKCGVALNPSTPISILEEILPLVDMVLIMTVNPGFGGQKYITYCGEKVAKIKKISENMGYDFDIEVDGGINMETIKLVKKAGANIFVAGSAIFSGDIKSNAENFLAEIKF